MPAVIENEKRRRCPPEATSSFQLKNLKGDTYGISGRTGD